MRILTSKYWKHFKKTIYQKNGKKKIVKDGKRFEQLIKSILDFEYGEGLWVDTGETWDGSRDFEYREPDYFRWAECKNYEASISLNVLSNTLVMAMIDFADEILIFSYSKIKKPVLDKIIRFADVSGKVLRIYSDESLEDVILKHIDKLKKDFFPEYNLDFDKLYLQPYVSCNVVSDPVTAYTTNADLGLISKKPNTIDFTSILCLSILVYNRNNTSKTFKIEIDWTKTEKCFKVLNNSTSKAIEFELEGNTAANKKIYFQVIKYKSELKLPQITISYDTLRKEYVLGKVKCLWIGECSIQGDLYKKTCYDFNNMLNSNFFKANNIYGTSGTGKSRLLKECEKLALSKGYRVIRFSVEDKYNNEKFVFKLISEFIYTVYDIPYIDNKSIICKNYSSDIYEMFLKINSLNETYIIDNVIPIITKKLMCSKCYITFDNIQFYPKFFVTFINEIVENIVINNKHCKCKMSFVFNTDYMNIYSECSNFYSFLNCNKSLIKSYPINGFANTNETKDFLNILLHDSNINELHLNKIIEKSQNKPYYITAYLSTLELNGILKKRKDSYYIPPNKYSDFEENVSNFPNNVKETIKKRWNLFLIKNNENEVIRIISILHIFQILNTEIIKSFLLSNSVISELCECHFIKLTNKKHNIYCFEHDLIEKFFCEEYFPLCSFAFDNKTPEYSFYWYMKIYQIINKQSISI